MALNINIVARIKLSGKLKNLIYEISTILIQTIVKQNVKEWEKAAKAHGEFFSQIRPACTFIEVNGLID